MATNLLQLGSYVQQGFDEGRQQGLERRYNRLAGQAFNAPDNATRDAAVGQIAVNNPSAAMALRGQFQEQDDRNTRLLTNMARYMKGALDSKNDQAIAGAWKAIRPALIKSRLATEQEISPNWDPSYEQTVHQLLAMGGPETAAYNQNKVIGDALVGPDGNVLYQAERQPEYMWSDRAGAWIPNPNNALLAQRQGSPQGTPANPLEQGGTQARVADDAELANQMIAAGIPEAQVDAFLATRMNPNAGTSFAAAGGLEPVRVAGVGPKPEISAAEQIRLDMAREASARADRAEARADRAEQRQVAANSVSGRTPNEGERNASGFYQRMVAANAELKRLTDSGYDPTNLRDHLTVGNPVGNFFASNEGQQYHQAAMNWVRANLRKESGAAIGVDEARQEIANYFPQPGDTPDVVRQKTNNRLVVEQAMLQAAGRATPQRAAAQPAAAAPLSNPTPQRARNPQTGEVLELRNGQWVPAR